MKRSNIIILTSVIACVVLFCIGGFFLTQKINSVPKNPPGTIGATAGNLQNGGKFCEADDMIYFCNPNDNDYIYRMKSDCTDIKRFKDSAGKYLNISPNYVYFSQLSSGSTKSFGFISNVFGIYSSKIGKNTLNCLKKTTVGNIKLIDDTIYYLNYTNDEGYRLYSIQTNGKKDTEIIADIVDPSCYANNCFYYVDPANKENMHLRRYNLETKANEVILAKDVYMPQYANQSVFYLDVHNNYHLCCLDLATMTETEIVPERVELYNIAGDKVYYQTNSKEEPYLGFCNQDGSNPFKLAYGTYHQIYATTHYVFFSPFNNDDLIYKTSIGSTDFDNFCNVLPATAK